jgi:hypothetical protein
MGLIQTTRTFVRCHRFGDVRSRERDTSSKEAPRMTRRPFVWARAFCLVAALVSWSTGLATVRTHVQPAPPTNWQFTPRAATS